MLIRCLTVLAFLFVTASGAEVSFTKDIAPVLTEKCIECHRDAKRKGSYRLDTFEQLLRAGESELPAVTPGKPDASELYRLLIVDDEADRMPKKADPLSLHEMALIKQWITQGAKFDGPDRKSLLSDSLVHTTTTPPKYPRPLPVTGLAASPDGKQLATSGYGEILIWDLGSQTVVNAKPGEPPPPRPPFVPTLLARIGNLPERVLAIEWSSQGNVLAVAGGTPGRGGELWLVDAIQRKPVKRLLTTPDTLLCLTLNREQNLLAAAGTDNHVRVYDLPSGRLRWNTEGHADWITSLAFSPDSKLLATASRDRTARLFDVAKGDIATTHTGHEVAVLSIAFDEDGKTISSGAFDGQIRRWNADGSSEKSSTSRPTRDGVLQLLQRDKRAFASFGNGRVVEMDLAGKKVIRTLVESGPRTDVLGYIATPPTLVMGTQGGEVRLFDLGSNQERGKFTAVP